jgi:hypothetical protein
MEETNACLLGAMFVLRFAGTLEIAVVWTILDAW